MHGQPADRPQTRAADAALTGKPRVVVLCGPAARTEPVRRELLALGIQPRTCTEFEGFMEALFAEPPWGVAVWTDLPDVDRVAVLEVLRHHLGARKCAVALVGEEASGRPDGVPWPVLAPPVSAEGLLGLFRECLERKTESAGAIPRILVVDDDPNIVLLGSHIVTSLGMIPIVAFDGSQAVDKAQHHQPDLILLDINMPGMDGFQVIEAIKADSALSLTPIIVFSARKSDEDKVRALKGGADDYVTKPFSITELGARIDRLIQRTQTGVSASSTTGLPGSVSIEQILVDRIRKQVPLAVLYLDADHFKAFNDRYGFLRGDSVIRQTATLILDAVRSEGNPDDFVGHIGGDDFIAVTTPDLAERVCRSIIERFERIIPFYYDPGDRQRGYVETEDRKGRSSTFPVMTLSIVVVTNESRQFSHPGEIADVAAQLKKYAKAQPGSVWVKDQRGNGA